MNCPLWLDGKCWVSRHQTRIRRCRACGAAISGQHRSGNLKCSLSEASSVVRLVSSASSSTSGVALGAERVRHH
jgi:hypothetical protein